jgi:hypothetical protein
MILECSAVGDGVHRSSYITVVIVRPTTLCIRRPLIYTFSHSEWLHDCRSWQQPKFETHILIGYDKMDRLPTVPVKELVDKQTNKQTNSGALVRQRTIPTKRPPLVGVVSTSADRGCCVVSATNFHGRQFRFSRPEPLLSFQVAPQLSSRGWVDPVADPLLLR